MNPNVLTPISIDSPDWSPLSGYQYDNNTSSAAATTTTTNNNQLAPNNPASKIQNRPNNINTSSIRPAPAPLDTPPTSGHSSANSASTTDGPMQNGRPLNGNPSPPSSLARSSVGTIAGSVMDGKKYAMIEEVLADHHRVLARYLAPSLRDSRADPRQNRARDKLLRLSPGQFLELSTDVYDELLRREEERRRGGPNQPGNPVPKYLLPRTNFHFKRNQARQKLSTLPPDRFQQLATDVFFELERRFPRFGSRSESRADSISSRTSPGRSNAYPPRGQSRGPPPDSRSVSREGFRPQYDAPPTPGLLPNGFGRPLPRQYQSNVMIPNKGTMVEDDSDMDGMMAPSVPSKTDGPDPLVAEYRSQVQALEAKVDELQIEIQQKDGELEKARSAPRELEANIDAERSQFNNLRNDLERRVKDAQALNDSLQAELAKVRSDHSNAQDDLQAQLEDARIRERNLEMDLSSQLEETRRIGMETEQDLRAQLDASSRGLGENSEWQQRYESLERELANQRHTTEEVRQEASQFLQEMRILSHQSVEAVEKEDRLLDQIAQLERDVRDWKSRYAKSKSQARSLRSSVMGLPQANGSAPEFARGAAFTSPTGLIKDFHVTRFQLAIDELLHMARDSDYEALIESMKNVVMAVREITSDMDTSENGASEASSKQIKLKARVSHSANHLITTAKSHASAAGIAPVSLIDAAASHLTAAVVDIVRALKIRPSSADELSADHEEFIQLSAKPAPLNARGKSTFSESSRGSTHMRNASMSSNGYSTYSRYSSRYSSNTSPQQLSGEMKGLGINQAMGMLRENGIEEFKNYLEDTTAILVRSIQPLVNTIRGPPSPDDGAMIAEYTRDISMTVQDIVTKTNAAVTDLKDPALSKHAPPVIKALEATCGDLLRHSETGDIDRIPPTAFKIARATKELVLRVDRIESGQLTADMMLPFEF